MHAYAAVAGVAPAMSRLPQRRACALSGDDGCGTIPGRTPAMAAAQAAGKVLCNPIVTASAQTHLGDAAPRLAAPYALPAAGQLPRTPEHVKPCQRELASLPRRRLLQQ